jgi:ligand-binding sensor domain-containing protein
MRVMLQCWFTAILFTINPLCYGQTIREQFSFRHLTEENGLSYNIVNSVIKDKLGFLWIATYDGLNRFDGFHFTVYKNNRRDTTTLVNNTVHKICEDREGNIWAATEEGISCWHIKTGKFTNYPMNEFIGPKHSANIVCGKDDKIWATSKGGLVEYVREKNSFNLYAYDSTDIYSLSSNFTYKNGLVEDPQQKGLWLATSKGLNFFDYSTKKFTNYRNNKTQPDIFNDHIVSAITTGNNHTIVYADNALQQINKLETNSYKLGTTSFASTVKNGPELATILEDSRGNYWVCSWTYKLFVIDGKTPSKQTLFHHENGKPNSVTGDFFWSAMEDKEGTIWLGTVGGISYTNTFANTFELHELHSTVPSLEENGGVYSMEEDADGTLWMGTIKNGLLHYAPATGKMEQYNAPLYKQYIDQHIMVPVRKTLIIKDKIIVGTNEGLLVFDKHTKRFSEMPGVQDSDGLQQHAVAYIVRQNDSIIWVRSYNNGVHRYNLMSNKWRHYGIGNDSVFAGDNSAVRNIFVDNLKQFWLFGVPRKLALYDEKKDAFVIQNDEAKDSVMGYGYFADITIDKQNRFWLATKGSGLVLFDPATKLTKRWSESEGLVFNHLLAVQMDNEGRVWGAGYNKLSMFDPASGNFQNFSFQISRSNYSYVNHFIKLADGRLVVSINSTLVVIDPAGMQGIKSPRQTLVTSLKIFDKLKPFDPATNTVSLRHFENFINISYGIITYSDPDRYEFLYKLEGYDKNWIAARNATSAAYTSLPGGDYTFHVKAISKHEKWEAREAVLHIKIVPPFYKTTWFYALLTLIFAALIFAMVRYRIYTIRKTAQQKNDINKMMNEWQLKALRSQMNPHFIFNCLNSIDNYILKNDEENASRYLNKFSRLVRLILNQSDTNVTTVAKEVEMLKYYMELETLRFDEPFAFKIEVDEDIDTEETEIPSMLLQPYVENAILHGLKHKEKKGYLHIRITTKNDKLLCSVEDNGIGRKRAAEIKAMRPELHTSKGLGITEQRLKMLQEAGEGTAVVKIIDLLDDDGNAIGTRVDISIPFEKD